MHDEASPNYIQMVDQTLLGHEYLYNAFDRNESILPKSGWQIDPFGHSRTNAYLTTKFGMKSTYFGRMNAQDRDSRYGAKNDRNFEWFWKVSDYHEEKIFSHFFFGSDGKGNYGTKFSFENPKTPDIENITSIMSKIEKFAVYQQSNYRKNHILWTMGSDFNYVNATKWFINLDKLVHYSKNSDIVNLIYSTPDIYQNYKLIDEKEVGWEVREDDIFPNSDGEHQYWTGFFSSRPNAKYFFKLASNYYNAWKHIASVENINFAGSALRRSISVAMHHDGVTGTAKQAVANDYSFRISKGIHDAKVKVQRQLGESFNSCLMLNISYCPSFTNLVSSLKQEQYVYLYNSVARSVKTIISLPVTLSLNERISYEVISQGRRLNVSTRKISHRLKEVSKAYANQISDLLQFENKATHELLFEAELQGLSMHRFHVKPSVTRIAEEEIFVKQSFIENEQYRLEFTDFEVKMLQNKRSNIQSIFSVELGYYVASEGNVDSNQPAGAYIFRPVSNELLTQGVHSIKAYKNTLLQRLEVQVNDWLVYEVLLHKGSNYIEFKYVVGPISLAQDNQFGLRGKEVVVRYTVDREVLENKGQFLTDANGWQIMKRTVNEGGSSYPRMNIDEVVAQNFYPVSSFAFINDDSNMFCVLTDTPEAAGSTSITQPELQFLLHRRLVVDDYRGVDEALNETMCGCRYDHQQPEACRCKGLISVISHKIIFDTTSLGTETRRELHDQNMHMVFTWHSSSKNVFSGNYRGIDLPVGVNVITFEKLRDDGDALIRISSDALIESYVIDLKSVFGFEECLETGIHGFIWNKKTPAIKRITLSAEEIRTFRCFKVKAELRFIEH